MSNPHVPDLAATLPELEATLEQDRSARNVVRVAEAFRLAGRCDRAVELLNELLDEEPTRISPRVLLAWCLQDLGRVEDAERALEEVRSLDPGNPFATAPEPERVEPTEEPAVGVTAATPSPDGTPPDPIGEPTPAEPAAPETPDVPERPDFAGEWEAEPERALTASELAAIPPGPLYSATLADIFERQGFEEKAAEIYAEVLRAHPERADLRERLEALKARIQEGASS